MTVAALQESLTAAGAQMGYYRGAPAAANFGDWRSEFGSLRNSSGLYEMSWRAKLAVTGTDRVRWLNGMVTNNVRDLAAGHGVYSFLLTAQGRIVGDMEVFERGEYLLLETDAAQFETVRSTLDKFIIMDDVELTDITDKLASIGLTGPKSREVLTNAGFGMPSLEPLQVADITWNGIGLSVVRGAHQQIESYEIWSAPENSRAIWDALVAAGALPVGTDALERFRIASGIPAYAQDIRERDLPQETNQFRALHFSKGCYVGQEIVERIRARGNVHRGLAGFILEGPPPEPGTKLQVEGKDVGEITSSAIVPTRDGERTLALGYVRNEHAAVGTGLTAGQAVARVAELPFDI